MISCKTLLLPRLKKLERQKESRELRCKSILQLRKRLLLLLIEMLMLITILLRDKALVLWASEV